MLNMFLLYFMLSSSISFVAFTDPCSCLAAFSLSIISFYKSVSFLLFDLRSSQRFRTKTRQENSGDICTHSINLTTKHKSPTAHLIVGFAKIVSRTQTGYTLDKSAAHHSANAVRQTNKLTLTNNFHNLPC